MIDVLVPGLTSVRSSIANSGVWSIGHRKYSLGTKIHWHTEREREKSLMSILGWFCPWCNRFAKQVMIERRKRISRRLSLGEFSIKGKIRYAIKANLIFYGTLVLIFVVLIIYVATKYTLTSASFVVKSLSILCQPHCLSMSRRRSSPRVRRGVCFSWSWCLALVSSKCLWTFTTIPGRCTSYLTFSSRSLSCTMRSSTSKIVSIRWSTNWRNILFRFVRLILFDPG